MNQMNALRLVNFALAVGLMSVVVLNVTGFCYAQRRCLSDQELIKIAIEFNLQWPHAGNDPITYSSANDLLLKNPGCCVVLRGDRGLVENLLSGRWVRIFGWYIAAVELWYQVRPSPPLATSIRSQP
jgi:hypothetical protein